jgi:DNA-nicking Smr family endonuclease
VTEDAGPPRRRGRRLTADERALWNAATRAVRPIRRAHAAPPAESSAPSTQSAEPTLKLSAVQPSSAPTPVRRALKTPPLAPLPRRLTQRVARGHAAIDARIDLHGLTQERAHDSLLHFLRRAQANAARLVLVITGKGGRGGAGRGVLHAAVPHWLALPAFRAYVIGFERAHVSHGGDGALYVQIRRARG